VTSASTPRLVAVCVGRPKDVAWRGRTVHTGVWKRPVDGPRLVRALNIDGDGQGDLAGHGGPHRAVLVYQLEAYEHLGRELGRTDLEPGHFGENFTVDGLADDEVCIGDRYEIGGALFEVSQPRVTCYRVGLRMDEPRLPSLMVAHHRPGFYLRVLREGLVKAGDPVVRVATGPERMTVAEVDGLLYLPGHDRRGVARALRIPALSPGWHGSFEAMLAADGDGAGGLGVGGNVGLTNAASSPPPVWPGFRPLRVVGKVPESADVVSLRLAAPDAVPLPAALPGQFVAVRFDLGDTGDGPSVLTRSYSLSGPPGAPEYRLSVKRELGGVASTHVSTLVEAGSVVDVAAPRGTFTLAHDDRPILLVSAGIGVTPVLAMLHALAAAGSDQEVWWLHGARNSAEHPFAAEAGDLLARLPNARTQVCYSSPLPHDRLGVDYTRRGRLSGDLLAGLGLPAGADAYVCGPVAFMADLTAALRRVGLDAQQVHTEVFGAGPSITPGVVIDGDRPPPHQPAGEPGDGPTVTFARSGLTTRWRRDDTSLLELAEACDVPARWSCRTGVCHTCETALLAGSLTHDPAPVDEPAAGNALICCASPDGDVVLDL
jgi:ferredoxin-NADP reductase/MOSC domain-containing protein YiiM